MKDVDRGHWGTDTTDADVDYYCAMNYAKNNETCHRKEAGLSAYEIILLMG